MSDILCMYYSRTGNTKKAMEEIAGALGAELVELSDEVDRSGWKGWLRCGIDAMRRTTAPLKPFQTEKALKEYKLVILGTPVWAGRCSSVLRGFLKKYGKHLQNAAYVLTRSGEDKYEEIYDQLDMYTPCGHQVTASLRCGSVGYVFWQEEFLRQVREYMEKNGD